MINFSKNKRLIKHPVFSVVLIMFFPSFLFSVHAQNPIQTPVTSNFTTTNNTPATQPQTITTNNIAMVKHTTETNNTVARVIPSVEKKTPHNLSPWGMFINADRVVKAVMISLAFASIACWTVCLSKSIEIITIKRQLKHHFAQINTAHSLNNATAIEKNTTEVGKNLINAAQHEIQLSINTHNKEGIKERVASSLQRIEAGNARHLAIGTGLLATIGATAPFIGLFGTVWGIMNSFIGISKSQTTSLAVVAPGIAEALLATAMGLVAAIPAVIIYNHFSRQITATKALVTDITAAVMRLVSRELDYNNRYTVVAADTSYIETASKIPPQKTKIAKKITAEG